MVAGGRESEGWAPSTKKERRSMQQERGVLYYVIVDAKRCRTLSGHNMVEGKDFKKPD